MHGQEGVHYMKILKFFSEGPPTEILSQRCAPPKEPLKYPLNYPSG
jgi:hypothetical protein